jgi:hypothetical protein
MQICTLSPYKVYSSYFLGAAIQRDLSVEGDFPWLQARLAEAKVQFHFFISQKNLKISFF